MIELAEQDSLVGEFEIAQKSFDKALRYFGDMPLPADFMWEIGTAQLRIHEGLGEFDKCIETLNQMVVDANEADGRLRGATEWAEKKKEEIEDKKGALDSVALMLSMRGQEAKKTAGTEGAHTLHEANQWVIGTLLDWWDGTRYGLAEPTDILNLWGEANYGRAILNHRAYPGAFHLCVAVSNVEQARTACRMLSPICDCLTLVWTGEVLSGTLAPGFPRHLAYDEPTRGWKPRPEGFWEEIARGYPICMPPFPRCLMPMDIVLFFLDEARALTERGRLFLVPGPGVGIVGEHHALSAQMYYQVARANAVLKVDEKIGAHPELDMAVPWFPNIPIPDLASLCDDHQDNFLEFRLKCMEWGDAIREGRKNAQNRAHTEIQLLSRKLDRIFQNAQGSADPDGQLAIGRATALSGKQDASGLPVGLKYGDIAARLRRMFGEDLDENPWFPYWSFGQTGANWQLGSAISGAEGSDEDRSSSRDLVIRSGMAFHWLRAPGEHKMYVILVKDDGESDLSDAVLVDAKEWSIQNTT